MTTLVTGGAGYIGSVTTQLLRARGEQVVVLDNLSRGHRGAVASDIPFYEGNVGDRDLAASLRGCELILDREELDAPDKEEFYVGDLVGLEVYDEAGTRIGSVADILERRAHDILFTRDDEEETTEYYVPFTKQHVPTVDLEGGRVVVDISKVTPE